MLRLMLSYVRLLFASWLFMGGIALQFLPTTASLQREARWRERQLQSVPTELHEQWMEQRDTEYARSYAYMRGLGVLIGGLGFAASVREAAYLFGRYCR